MENKKTFRSRISVLVIIFILAIFVPISIPMIKYMIIPGLLIMGISFLFIVFIFGAMRYHISMGNLYISSVGNVRILDILSIKRSYNPLGAPASSLKRLRIDFRKGTKYPYLLISPVREQEFIETLKAINPDIEVNVSDKKGIWRIWDWDI